MTKAQRETQFQSWLKDHRRLLFKVVRAYAVLAEDQDDLFQEICLQIWRSVDRFKGQAKLSTWLYRIALNTAISWERKTSRQQQIQHGADYRQYLLIETSEGMDERLSWLYDEIRRLNRVDRSILLLKLDGYSYQEVSEILGISTNQLGVKLHRLKQQLSKRAEIFKTYGIH
ncbi:MAG: sigma-70 family RNA polymerase sigma factor [Bacteroidota bacterium]